MNPNYSFLPYGRQTIEADDIAAVGDALTADFLTTGPLVDRFDELFARTVSAKYAVSCNSGTAALHLAALAIGLGPGDVAIVPSITFLATANAIRYVGGEVIFADVDPDTGLLRPQDVVTAMERHPGARIKAVLPVHMNGQATDMSTLTDIIASRDIHLIEDACHALGAAGVGACAASTMACFSMHPVKAIAMGEGGAVSTNDPALAERLRRFRNHGMSRDSKTFTQPELAFDKQGQVNPWYYEMQEPGFNYRAPDILCALGLSQLKKLGRFIARRRHLAALYDEKIAPLAPLVRPVPRVSWSEHAYHLYAVLIDFDSAGIERKTVIDQLRSLGIGSQVHYLPVSRQPYYTARYGKQHLPGADAYYARCLSLPIFPTMADSDVDRVIAALKHIIYRK